jgi:DNA polymerase-3 subunit beta
MQLKISKSIIENILNNVINFIEKKDNSQITSHILLEANDKLIIKATDREFGIEFEDNTSEIIQKGKITLNGRKFFDIIKALNDDFINIEIVDNIAIISQNHSIYKLPTFEAEQFPEFPEISSLEKIELNSFDFIEGLKKVFLVIDSNNPKYELNGALLDISNDFNIVATDTKRLALYGIKNKNPKDIQIIIPKKAISEIKKLFLDNFEIYFNEINLMIKSNNITFFTQLINGKFPDYKRIIPNEYKHIIKLNKQIFTKAVKQINVISNDIKITINNNQMFLESISDETFEAKTDIEIKSDLDNFVFAVNSKFVLDFLNVVDDEIEICLNEENIPFTLRDKNFQTIIMPLSI